MTAKERKEVRRSLRESLDRANRWIQMAVIGDEIGVTEMPEESLRGREQIISELKGAKQEITDKVALLLSDIDEAIDKMTC